MSIDPADAARALDTVRQSRTRALTLRGYTDAGDIVIAWGLVWLAGNLASQFSIPLSHYVWPIGIAAASLFSVFRPRFRTGRRTEPRIPLTIAAAFGYMLLVMLIVGPDRREANVMTSLLVAACYIATGIWAGSRFAVLGGSVVAAVLVGWYLAPAYLFACLAIGGGGTLLVGGWWLRRA